MMNGVARILALTAAGGSILLATACADVDRAEFDKLAGKVEDLDLKFTNKNSAHVYYHEGLDKSVRGLETKVTPMEILVRDNQKMLERLEDQVRILAAELAALRGTTPLPPGQKPPAIGLTTEELLREIEFVLTELRNGKVRTEEAAPKLKLYAKHAAPRMVDELRASITNFEYTKQLETILAQLPPDELKLPLQGALPERGVRDSAVRVIGSAKNPELAKLLEEHIASRDEDFRLLVGEALVQCRNAKGIPVLVQNLKSPGNDSRRIAIAALKRINRGESFGYNALSSAEQNAPAIKSWEEWADKYGSKLFE